MTTTLIQERATQAVPVEAAKSFVELKGVAKRFGSNTVLEGLDLAIPKGKMSRCSARPVAVKPPCCAWWRV